MEHYIWKIFNYCVIKGNTLTMQQTKDLFNLCFLVQIHINTLKMLAVH